MSNATSSGSPAPADRDETAAAAGGDPAYDASVLRPPLRPHRRLLVGTAVVLACWLGFLFYLYVTVVHPHAGQVRKVAPQPLTDIPGPSAVPAAPTEPVPVRPPTKVGRPSDPGELLGPIGPAAPAGPPAPTGKPTTAPR